jgi:hypothetical protein
MIHETSLISTCEPHVMGVFYQQHIVKLCDVKVVFISNVLWLFYVVPFVIRRNPDAFDHAMDVLDREVRKSALCYMGM